VKNEWLTGGKLRDYSIVKYIR